MRPLWIAIDSRSDETRVLATAGPRETVLKARLSPTPQHPRAVVALLEALAMWEGTMARAVVVVDDREGSGSSATRLKLDDFADLFGEPLYQLRFVHGHKRHHRDRVDGFGPFHDLRQLVMFEVAR
ncbi:MAG TPA: hypothetical protein VK389_00365 [Thermoanaerobaculia bacterium]|jgi:hypothetical protein|nr:hypothetical protein [Thermoanaerobaculia bacterium]